jgi:hypothetical protein
MDPLSHHWMQNAKHYAMMRGVHLIWRQKFWDNLHEKTVVQFLCRILQEKKRYKFILLFLLLRLRNPMGAKLGGTNIMCRFLRWNYALGYEA